MAFRKLIFAAVTLFSSSQLASALLPSPQPEMIAASEWLKSVDSKNYEKSWTDAGQLFRDSHTLSGWAEEVRVMRAPLGPVYTRFLQTAKVEHSDRLPGLPDGHYATVRFSTIFVGSKTPTLHMTERVTVDEEEAHWKVVGYFIE